MWIQLMFTQKAGKLLSQISDVMSRFTCLIKVDLIIYSALCWSQRSLVERVSVVVHC